MHIKFLVFTLFFARCYCCNEKIPESVKKQYSSEILYAFEVQSQGESTHACAYFEKGIESAKKAGESEVKLNAIRQLFAWYRTYGYYLNLMKKDPKIFGQYLGHGTYSTNTYSPYLNISNHGSNPEKDAKIRDYILGVSEILTGVLCFWLLPGNAKWTAGVYFVAKGFDRTWEAANALWMQNDIALIELKKTEAALKQAAKE